MANTDNPNGLTPVRHMGGGTIRASEYLIASGESTAIFSGDLVTLETDGYIEQADATDANLVGVFGGVERYDTIEGAGVRLHRPKPVVAAVPFDAGLNLVRNRVRRPCPGQHPKIESER